MPSPIPNANYAIDLDVNKPGETTQVGCVNCLLEGTHAPQEIIYYYGGYSMCMRHVQNALQKAQNPTHVS
jgi:hypothetical protein